MAGQLLIRAGMDALAAEDAAAAAADGVSDAAGHQLKRRKSMKTDTWVDRLLEAMSHYLHIFGQ